MNNTTRTVLFVVISTLIMLGGITLQNVLYPPVIPQKAEADPAANPDEKEANQEDAANSESKEVEGEGLDSESAAQDDGKTEGSDQPQSDQESKSESAGDDSQSSKSAEEKAAEPENPDAKLADDEAGKAQDVATEGQPAEKIEPAKPDLPHKYVTLGSLDAETGKRFLITLNTKGATVRRLESATRKPNGKLRYQNLDDFGYMGELESVDDGGCRVSVVGPGTPAALAGLQVGDVITSFDGEPVLSPADFESMLSETRPKQQVTLEVSRGQSEQSSSQTLNVTLTDKPLELLQPSYSLETGEQLAESFLMTLHQCKEVEPHKWVEIDKGMKNRNWSVSQKMDGEAEIVEFRYTIPKDVMTREEVGLDGPLTIVKKYSLSPVDLADLAGRTWHFGFEVYIECRSEQPIEVAYELGGPTGCTKEGWWYQMKINGSGSFFGMAGARDVTSETTSGRYTFFGNPDLVKNMTKDPVRQEPKFLFDPLESVEKRSVKYFGVDTQYFNVSILPDGEKEFICDGGFAWPVDPKLPENTRRHREVDCSGVVLKKVKFEPNQAHKQSFQVFAGPKEGDLLETYGLLNNRALGWFGMFSKPLLWILHTLYFLTFQLTYAIPVILLTVMVRCLMIPISRKAALNAQMMQYLSPQLKKLKEKYPDDMQKQMAAQQALFRKHKYNPFSGCLMGFIQLPIFIGLYRGLSVDIALRDQPLIPGMGWCSDLAAPDQLMRWDSWMPAFLASETGWLGPYLNILPLITIVLFVVNAKLFTPPPTDEQQAMMQKMMTYMMFFMGFLFFKVPAALCLYFITSSIWGIAERKLLPKPKLDTGKLDSLDDLEIGGKQSATIDEDFSNRDAMEEKKRRARDRKKKLRDRDRN